MSLLKLAEGQDLLLIPAVQEPADWTKLAALTPKFVYVHETVEKLPPVVGESQMMVIGPAALADKFALKCVVEECSK